MDIHCVSIKGYPVTMAITSLIDLLNFFTAANTKIRLQILKRITVTGSWARTVCSVIWLYEATLKLINHLVTVQKMVQSPAHRQPCIKFVFSKFELRL